jgi:hypothetical protein
MPKRKRAARKLRRAQNPMGAAVAGPVRFSKVGGSYMITVPRGWVEAHKLDPRKCKELFALADEKLMVIHNPEMVREKTRRVHDEIDKESRRLKRALRLKRGARAKRGRRARDVNSVNFS